ncbi:MAG: aminotransferase class IV [Proteocatella sp.]
MEPKCIKTEEFQIISDNSYSKNQIELDDGFLYGIGFFETILIRKNACFLKEHIERINKSLENFNIPRRLTKDSIDDLVRLNKWSDTVLKIIVTEKNAVALVRPILYTQKQYQEGLRLCLSSLVRSRNSFFVNHKSLNYGDCIIAMRLAKSAGFDDCLLSNESGHLTESSIANLFIIEDDKLITPPLSEGLLPGITRNEIISSCQAKEEPITAERLLNSQGAFLTNSVVGVIGIRAFEGREIPQHRLVHSIRMDLEKKMREF